MRVRLSRHGGIDERVRKALAIIVALAMVTSGFPTQALAEVIDELDANEQVVEVIDDQEAPEEEASDEEAAAPAGEEAPEQEAPAEDEPARAAPEPDAGPDTELVVAPETKGYVPGDDGTSSKELLDAYARQRLDEALPPDAQEGPARVAPEDPTDSMTDIDRAAFELLRAQIKAIAAGEEASTEVTLYLYDLTSTYSLDAEELGVDDIIIDGQLNEEAQLAAEARFIPNIDKVIDALLAACPYELYWYDKMGETETYTFSISYSSTRAFVAEGGDATITIAFPVAAAYAGDEPFTVVSELPAKIDTALATAQEIVDDNESMVPYDRLAAYKDAICDLVSYDYDSANDDSTPYGDPWQLISVFDGDPSTNVVCEGYAKAFKYLCDLSYNSDATSITVTGWMSGATGDGPHMWNVVTMDDGRNYLVDVTNCDDDSTFDSPDGQDPLFVAIPDSGSVDDGYDFSCFGETISYSYDHDEYDDMLDLYGRRALTLSAAPYGEEAPEADLEDADVSLDQDTFTYDGSEHEPQVTVTYQDEVLEEGTHYTVSYEDNVGSSDEETTATVTITAIEGSGYTGSQEVTFTIEPGEQPSEGTITSGDYQITPANLDEFESEHNYASEADITWTYIDEGAENGFRVTFDEQTQLEDNYDYLHVFDTEGEEIASYTGGELAGATIDIPSPGQFTLRLTSDGSVTYWGFKVSDVQHLAAANDLSRATVALSQTTYKYDGTAHEPEVTVMSPDGDELVEGADYTVSYANNTELGDASVTVTAVDGSGYTGSQTVTFVINETGYLREGTYGGIAWFIDESGALVIEPTVPEEDSGYAEGELPGTGYGSWPWYDDDLQDLVSSVEVREGVKVNGSISGLFAGLRGATTMDLGGLDTSGVVDMSSLFQDCSSLETLDLTGFDTSEVTYMGHMFNDCSSLTSVDLSSFDTSQVTDMAYLFGGCSSLEELDLSDFETSSVESMNAFFYDCSSLASLDLSSFDTSHVLALNGMFEGCSSLETLNLSSFETSQVEAYGDMFWECDGLSELVLGQGYVIQGTDMVPSPQNDLRRWWSSAEHRWYTPEQLAAARGSAATAMADTLTDTAEPGYEYHVSAANVTVHNLSRADAQAGVRPEVIVRFDYVLLDEGVDYTLAFTADPGMDTGTVTVTGQGIYCGSTVASFVINDHGEQDGGALGEGDVSWWLGYDDSLTIAPNDGTEGTFACAVDEDDMYDEYGRMERWPWYPYRHDITSVTVEGTVHATGALTYMFYELSSARSFDLAGLETSGATSMKSMFEECRSVTSLDLTSFDTSQVTDFEWMFAADHCLASLDLSSFDLTAADTPHLFEGNYGLAELKVGPLFVGADSSYLPEPTASNGKWWSDAEQTWLTTDQIAALRSSAEGRVADTFRDACDAAHANDLSGAIVEVRNLSRAQADAGAMPEVTVVLNETDLTPGTDYTLTNEVKGDTGTVTVTGMGDYTGSTTADYSITEYGERTSGPVGESDVIWRLAYDGTLTITPADGVSGTLPDNDEGMSDFWPWYELSSYINAVVVEGGVKTGSDARYLFAYLDRAESIDLGGLDTSDATLLGRLFSGDCELEQIDLSSLDTHQVTDFSWMFSDCYGLSDLALEDLDTSNAVSMRGMFYDNEGLTELDLSSLNTSSVTDMAYLFDYCDSLVALDLSMLDMGGVRDVEGMFKSCDSLESLALPASFTARDVDDLSGLFCGCSSLTSLDLSHLDTRELADRDAEYEEDDDDNVFYDMFQGCDSLAEFKVGEHYVIAKADAFPAATADNGLWWSTSAERWLSVEQIVSERSCVADIYTNVAGDAGAFDLTGATIEVKNQVYTGEALTPEVTVRLNGEPVDPSVYDVTYADNTEIGTATVTVTARDGSGYRGATTTTFKITKHGGQASGTIGTCDWWVSYDGVLTIAPSEGEVGSLPNNSGGSWGYWPWQDEASLITSVRFEGTVVAARLLNALFAGLEEVRAIDCTGLDTSAVTHMTCLFENCEMLESVDLSSLDTQSVTDMSSMFGGCHSLGSLDLSGFDTSHVTSMSYMFGSCRSLAELDLTSFDTSAVETTPSSYEENVDSTGFESMFSGCYSLASLDLSSFDTSSTSTATGGNGLFEQCGALASLTVGTGYVMNDLTIPEPTAQQGWFSTADGAWYTAEQLKGRSGIADTYRNEGDGERIDIMEASATLEDGPFTYTGSAIEPQVTVTYEGTTLVEGTDFTLGYANNTDAGDAVVTISGKGAYTGSCDLGFAIGRATLTAEMVEVEDAACAYDGSGQEPEVTVTFGGTVLERDVDYTITCANNVAVDDGATVTVTGTGNFAGEVTKGFSIAQASLATAVVSAPTQTYSGSPLTPEPTVLMGGTQLVNGTDFEVVGYGENTNASERAKVTVRGLGNYTGEITGTFTIVPASLAEAQASADAVTYVGQALTPRTTVVLGGTTLVVGTDYTVTCENNVNAGSDARFVVAGTGNYTGEVAGTFAINPAEITGIDPIANAAYQGGSPVEPRLTVRAGTLTLGTDDYDAVYENNTELGATATVTVTGKGNFAGSASATFTITEMLDDPTADDSVLNELTKAYDDAVDAAEQAAADVAAKEEALGQAEAAKQDVEDAYQALVDAVDAAQEELTAAQGVLAQKQEALEAAQAEKDDNDAAITEAQEAKDAADADVTAKQEALEAAQAARDSAEQAVAGAQQTVEDKQAALDAALAAAEVQKAKGSIGFFETVGATAAADVLKRSDLKTLPQQGDPDDAIALDNMKDTFQWLKYHNQLRTSLGLSELKVSDLLMAYAQADADYSDTVMGHAQQFRDTSVTGGTYGENVAWNYGSNPYAQWYDEEKGYFDEAYRSITGAAVGSEPTGAAAYSWYVNNKTAVSQYLNQNLGGESVGHYTNDINPNFVTTGFAICTRGTMSGWQTDCQFFGGNIDAYTVDAYEARFMEYYDSLQCTAEQEALEAAQAELADRQAALEDAQAALEAAQAAYDASVATAADAAAALEELQANTAGLEAAIAAAEQERGAAEQAVAGKQAAYDDAVAARDAYNYPGKLAAAEAAIETAQQELDDARDAKDAADAAVTAAKDRLDASCDLSQATVLGVNDVTYTGSQQRPVVVVHLTMQGGSSTDTYQLTEGTDYTVSYGENTEVGTASVTVTGMGTYSSSKTVEFAITRASLSAEMVSVADAGLAYDGTALEPEVTVTFGGKALARGVDFDVTYSDNVDAGTAAKATVTGRGNFDGSVTVEFAIVPRATTPTVEVAAGSLIYDGTAKHPHVTVRDGATVLPEDAYDVAYEGDCVDAGTHVVTVTLKGNYVGTGSVEFAIAPKPATVAITLDPTAYVYTGSTVTPQVARVVVDGHEVTEADQADPSYAYDVSVPEGAKDVGTHTVTITLTGEGNYVGSGSAEFAITPAQITGIDEIASVRYTGAAATPAMTVRAGDLILGSGDYTASYQDNDAVGTATVTVTGKGNFDGTKSRKFKVVGDPSGPDDEGSVYHELSDAVDVAEARVQAAEQGVQAAEQALADAQAAAAADPTNQELQAAVTAAEGALADAQDELEAAKAQRDTARAARDAALDLANATVTGIVPSVTYDGSAHEQPGAVVAIELTSGSVSDRYVLAEGTDYTVTYADNTDVGTATMTITAKAGGRYTGSKTVEFAITKAPTAITAADKTLTGPSSVALGAKATAGAGALSYASSDPKVATVDATGKVTAVSAGTAKVTVSAAASGTHVAASKTVTITVRKAANPLVAKAKKATAKVKYKKVRKKKQTVKNLVVSGQQGTVSYKLVKAKKTKKWKVNAKTGALTVPKKTKKGTYTVKVQVTAAGNGLHEPVTKVVKFKVKVK